MKIKVPTPEESKKEKHKRLCNFLLGIFSGIIVFGLLGSRVFWLGIYEVDIYTWFALSVGVLSFGFLAMWFGDEFWQKLFGNN